MNDQQRSTPQPFDDGPRSAVDPHLLPVSARQSRARGLEPDAASPAESITPQSFAATRFTTTDPEPPVAREDLPGTAFGPNDAPATGTAAAPADHADAAAAAPADHGDAAAAAPADHADAAAAAEAEADGDRAAGEDSPERSRLDEAVERSRTIPYATPLPVSDTESAPGSSAATATGHTASNHNGAPDRAQADAARTEARPDAAGANAAETTGAGTTAADTTGASTTDAGSTPAGSTPAGSTPAGTTPADTTAARTDTARANTAVVDSSPTSAHTIATGDRTAIDDTLFADERDREDEAFDEAMLGITSTEGLILPPQKRSNRTFAFILAVLTALVFATLYALVFAAARYLFTPGADILADAWAFAGTAAFYVPVTFFAVIMILWSVLSNRAGWWSYILASLLLGIVVFGGHYLGIAGQEVINGGTWSNQSLFDAIRAPENLPGALIAFIVARETSNWLGGLIAARGRRLNRLNARDREDYERRVAEERALSGIANSDVVDSVSR